MDMQVRYTDSVEQFQNMSAKKKKKSSNFFSYFIGNMEKEKCVNMQGQDKDIEK